MGYLDSNNKPDDLPEILGLISYIMFANMPLKHRDFRKE